MSFESKNQCMDSPLNTIHSTFPFQKVVINTKEGSKQVQRSCVPDCEEKESNADGASRSVSCCTENNCNSSRGQHTGVYSTLLICFMMYGFLGEWPW